MVQVNRIVASFSIEDMAADIASFLEEQEIEQVYMFGHSLGGYITLAFAEKFPGKIDWFLTDSFHRFSG